MSSFRGHIILERCCSSSSDASRGSGRSLPDDSPEGFGINSNHGSTLDFGARVVVKFCELVCISANAAMVSIILHGT